MNYFLFQVYPYVALTVAIVGSIARYERDPFTWKSKSSQFLRRKQLIVGSVLFHVGIIIIFFGHLIGLLTPIQVFDFLGISHGAKQLLAVVGGGIAGLLALAGGILLLHRRMTDPRIRATSTFADTGILWLLMVQLVLGLATITQSLRHLDGSEMVNLMNWAQSIAYFRFDAGDFIVNAHWLFKAHLFLGLTIILVFPFTRLVHMLSVPLRYLTRPGYQVVRSRRTEPLPDRAARIHDARSASAAPKSPAGSGALAKPAE